MGEHESIWNINAADRWLLKGVASACWSVCTPRATSEFPTAEDEIDLRHASLSELWHLTTTGKQKGGA